MAAYACDNADPDSDPELIKKFFEKLQSVRDEKPEFIWQVRWYLEDLQGWLYEFFYDVAKAKARQTEIFDGGGIYIKQVELIRREIT